MMIAKIVAEDKSYDEVLRSKEGVANPTIIHTLKKYFNFWNRVLPPGSYPTLSTEPAVAKVRIEDKNYKWIDRGPLHAGVLTTVALHRVTNGWRAKANRVMDAFMCRSFTVPDGIKVIPSEEAELIRMPYCQSCHATLEPLSQFFGRWPNLGNDSNFYYDPSAAVSSVGRLAGKEDADTRGLALIMSSLPDFNECAVKRAFHFAVGREMTTYEEETILAPVTEKFVASGKKLWPIIRDFTVNYTRSQCQRSTQPIIKLYSFTQRLLS